MLMKINLIFPDNFIHLTWATKTKAYPYMNFGDELSYYINKFLFPELNFVHSSFDSSKTRISSIGTILHNLYNGKILVWGSGLDKNRIHPQFNIEHLSIFAVRGKKTKQFLENLGLNVPDVFGDPAILLKNYIKVPSVKKYKIGIIPHCSNYFDVKEELMTDTLCFKQSSNDSYKIICPKTKNNIFSIIHDILSCETIVSESIHGCILADTFDIPNLFFQKRENYDTSYVITTKTENLEHRYDDYISALDVEKTMILHDPNLPLDYNQLYDYIIKSYKKVDLTDLISNLQKNHPLNILN